MLKTVIASNVMLEYHIFLLSILWTKNDLVRVNHYIYIIVLSFNCTLVVYVENMLDAKRGGKNQH